MLRTKEEVKESEDKLIVKLNKLKRALKDPRLLDDESQEYCILCGIARVSKDLQELHEESFKL